MKRIWMNVGVVSCTALLIGAISSACAHNDASVFIDAVLAPPQPSDGECVYSADISSTLEGAGTADVIFDDLSTYSPFLLIGNQILTQANSSQLQVETSRVILTGAITRITDLNGNDLLTMLSNMYKAGDKAAQLTGEAIQKGTLPTPVNPFSTVETAPIEPSSGSEASYTAMATTMIDGDTIDIMRSYFQNVVTLHGLQAASTFSVQLLTYTKVEGTTLGGDPVESNTFEFPVTVCFGCLTSDLVYYTNTTDPADDEFCVMPGSSTSSTGACVPGQDTASSLPFPNAASVPLCPGDGGTAVTPASTGDSGL